MRTPVPNRQISFWGYFPLAYQDAARVFRAMWPIVLTLVAGVLGVDFIGDLLHPLIGTRLGDGVLDLLVTAVTTFLIAPYLFALYRHADSGEMLRPEAIRSTPEAQRFAGWLVLTSLIVGVPLTLYSMFGTYTPVAELPPGTALEEQDVNVPAMLGIFMLLLGVWIFAVRTTTLMPMLALAPTEASFGASLAQSRGHFWFIVGVQFITMLPVSLGSLMVQQLISGMLGPLALIVQVPVAAVLTGFAQVMVVVVSARLYERFSRV